jgi:hypothetical protein
MAMSFDALRVGHTYRLRNYDDIREFKIVRKLNDKNFVVQDTGTMEKFELEDLVRYGKGKDYDLDEINRQGDII